MKPAIICAVNNPNQIHAEQVLDKTMATCPIHKNLEKAFISRYMASEHDMRLHQ